MATATQSAQCKELDPRLQSSASCDFEDALQQKIVGQNEATQALVDLRNHVETFLEYLKRSESDSGVQRAFRRDLEDAKEVQQAFFPEQTMSIPCISCETLYRPARGIGGDYYDLLALQRDRWGIAIGDVSGKGIGAALIMASLQASLKFQALRPHLKLSTLIGDVNRLVYESSPTNIFATLFYAEYEPAKRLLDYVNAGHNPPVILRPKNGSCDIFQLPSTGIPVGISADSQFASTTFNSRLMMSSLPTPMESQRWKTATTNSGVSKD
jgi:serine phosphatase RsbU (regulator of sigma subunit)